MSLLQQKSTDKKWYDETGQEIPFYRITKLEKMNERSSNRLLKKAKRVNKQLSELKELMRTLSKDAFDMTMKEKGISNPKTKGNYTWYNFNRTIKIEVNIHESIKFDDLIIAAAKEKFDEFLNQNITSENEFVKQMILDAFETQRSNQLDTKRVLALSRYESKIKNKLFSEAVKLISESIRRPNSKSYYRIWVKDETTGAFENVELNLSSL
jgi:hypothetical protein